MENNKKTKQQYLKKVHKYINHNKYWLSVHTLLLLILVNISSAYAASLINGGFISGAISTPTDKHSYTFSAQAGESVLISIADTSSKPFVPQINLYGPSGAYITYSLNRIEYKITESGTFTVDVFDQAAIGEKTGTYNLYFAHMPGANENEGGNLINGGHISDSIDLGDLDSYTFTAQAGESVLISLADTSDIGFAPRMYLYNNDGVFLEWDHNRIERTITENGTYTIVVLDSVSVGEKFGTYNLYFALIPGANENEGGELINGKVISDSIDLGDLDSYTYSARAGENIEFTINDTSAKGFVPRLYLYSPDGSFITWNKNSSKLFYTTSESGTYTVVVLDDVVIGERTGTYDLTLGRELGLSDVKITQAVFDTDGDHDLVLNRNTAILATVQSNIGSGITTLRVCVKGTVCDKNNNLGSTEVNLGSFSGSKEFEVQFISNTGKPEFFKEGKDEIIVEIDPDNLISAKNETKTSILNVNFTETKKLPLQYIFIRPKECESNPSIIVDCTIHYNNERVGTTIREANKLIQDVFPLPDNGVVINSSLPVIEMEGASRFFSLETDLVTLLYYQYKHFYSVKRVIGLVPEGYFEYHGRKKDVAGITNKFFPQAFLSSFDNSGAVAHELGHSFGFGEGYTEVNPGIDVKGYKPGEPSVYIGAGSKPKRREIMGKSNVTQYWISNKHWIELISKLKISGIDPELLVMGAVIRKDGSMTMLPWMVVDGISRFIQPGDYSVILKNIEGQELLKIPFGIGFTVFEEPFGEKENDAVFGFAIPYIAAAASVEVVAPDGTIIFVTDPVIKTFRDAIDGISGICYSENASENHQEMETLFQELEMMLINQKHYDAISLLETNFKNHVESTMVSNCYDSLTLKTSKEDLLNLISKTIPHIEARIINTDSDGDGIWDDKDTCPDTNINDTVIIQECDSDVTNTVMENGCSINDEVLNCDGNGNSMEQFVSCIDQLANRLFIDEIISIQDKELIQSCITKPVLGDLDDDGDVDRADYSLFRSTLGKCEGDDKFISTADYDDDECITYGDYRTWMGYYRNQ